MLWKYSYFGKSAAGSCADRALSGFAACESNGLTSFRVRDSHPIPLFSWNKNACPFGTAGAACAASASVRVAHLPQKPVIDSFLCLLSPRNDKKTAVSQAVRIHHIHLVFIHGCFHVFDKYQPKSATEQASCRCNRSLLFVCLPFRNDVHFCPGEFVYIQAITRLPSRRSKRITVARQSRNLTPLPLVTLVAANRRFDNLLI